MVRAKVTCLNPKNACEQVREKYKRGETEWDRNAGPWDKYLKVAEAFCFDLKPNLTITHGFSGSGKSTIAIGVIEEEGGIRIRSDVERQRVANEFQLTHRYSPEVNQFVYSRLLEKAKAVIKAGFPVVVDATFLKRSDREPFEQLANELAVDFRIVDCDAPFEVLCERIRNRKNDPSEADVQVLKTQMENHDPLTTDELQFVTTRHG